MEDLPVRVSFTQWRSEGLRFRKAMAAAQSVSACILARAAEYSENNMNSIRSISALFTGIAWSVAVLNASLLSAPRGSLLECERALRR